MRTAWVLVLLGALPLYGQVPDRSTIPPETLPASEATQSPYPPLVEDAPLPAPAWKTAWGVVGLRGIFDGPKMAPNGLEYHPNFSLDLDFNFWLWRNQGLYWFGDFRLWGEKGENGVTNGNDGFLGTSKREFDLSGGVAWNYAGPWELRASGYMGNNLNRGNSLVTPSGFTDGWVMENRYYLSSEYADLGRTGFDVTKATFVSVGYLPTKVLVNNKGQQFKPGLMLRAYVTWDLWDWRQVYAFADATYIDKSSFKPGQLIFDLGVAARPFRVCEQCEVRLGAESTADFQAHNCWSLWYASFRFVF
jgi:hypothetical protein